MPRAAPWVLLLLWGTMPGCRAPRPSSSDQRRTPRIAGLRAVEPDAYGIRLRRDRSSAWLLWADGRFTDAATVRPNETFLLRHPTGLSRWYRIVAVGQDKLSLIEVEERPVPGGGAQSRRVVTIRPYDLDRPSEP